MTLGSDTQISCETGEIIYQGKKDHRIQIHVPELSSVVKLIDTKKNTAALIFLEANII